MRKLFLIISAIFCLLISAMAQNRTITGRVTDEAGNAVQGASVIVRGTRIGTTTTSEGDFTLNVPANAKTLQVSSVNMTAQDVAITGSSVNVTLRASSATSLESVVVTGYGTIQKQAFTGSASKIDVKQFSNLQTPSIDKLLAGRASGVQVTNSTGLINAPARIRVRGINSISQNNDPLIIVDGAPFLSGNANGNTNTNLLGDINPEDIETIDVLKDGASLAIYGSRGAAGVILITTKRGSKGRLKVNYSGFLGFSSPVKKFDLLNADQFITIANEKLANSGFLPKAYRDASGTNVDWQNEVLVNNAPVQNHTLSLQGGSTNTTYYFSLNFSDQKGTIFTNRDKAYRIRMNIDHDINRYFKVGNNLSVSRQETFDQNTGSNSLGGAISSALRQPPNVSPYNASHSSGFNILYPIANSIGAGPNLQSTDDNYYNVAFTLRNNKQYADDYRIVDVAYIELSPLKFLKFRSQFSWDILSDYSFLSYDPRHGDGNGSNGVVDNAEQYFRRLSWQNYFTLNKSFGKHNVIVTAGHELSESETKWFEANGSNISDPFFQQANFISSSAGTQKTFGSFSRSGTEAIFARLNYDFSNKYFIQATIRQDGQSSLAPGHRYGTFPGFSIGWKPSSEAFWSRVPFLTDWFSNVKLKGSIAKVGNPLGGFPYLSTYGAVQYGGIGGLTPNLIGNTSLQWETSKKYDAGIEFSMLKNRINFTLDWFKNDINNLVLNVPTPPSAGIPNNSIAQNIGTQQNTGIEISANTDIIRTKDFTWNINANYSNVKNKILSLYSVGGVPTNYLTNGSYNIIRVGDPINIIYGYDYAGVNTANGNPMYYKYDKGSPVLVQHNIPNGVVYFANSLDDPTLGAATSLTFDDKIKLGVANPTWFGAVTNSFNFKGFSLDVMLRYSGGNKIMNVTRQEALLNQSFQNNGVEILQRWTTPGQITNVPKLYYGQTNNVNQVSNALSRFVESGDFLRLQDVVFSYMMNANTLRRIAGGNFTSVKFYVQGQNLYVWTKYTGVDPENISSVGVDAAIAPQIRTISLGVNIGF